VELKPSQTVIQEALEGVAVVWLEKVTDEQYLAGPRRTG
jgi:hypothetical protein